MGLFGDGLIGFPTEHRMSMPILHGTQMQRHANFEEFIQIGRHNAQIAQPFKHRYIGALGPGEHTLIECQGAVVAINQDVFQGSFARAKALDSARDARLFL
jgi:hypothetical protein